MKTRRAEDVGYTSVWWDSIIIIVIILTEFDPADFEVVGKHLQLPDLRGVHGGSVLSIPHALPLGVSLDLGSGAGAPGGLISGEEGRGQRRETVAPRTGAAAQTVVWKLVEAGGERA